MNEMMFNEWMVLSFESIFSTELIYKKKNNIACGHWTMYICQKVIKKIVKIVSHNDQDLNGMKQSNKSSFLFVELH